MNQVNLYHSGDLGDTVYSIPALRRLAYPAHVQLYPNPGVTRQVMDENNAAMILPLLNIQNGVSGSWVPTYSPDGLRYDFAVRRFYDRRYNLADIHNNYLGHDHWPVEQPWFVVDKPDYTYRIVVARSARYRSPTFPWRDYYKRFQDRACFVGVPWEHEDFEKNVGPIPYVRTESLLDVARIMAGADLVIANQSCPRAVAEGLKTPIIVEQGDPPNTHFGRQFAWYLHGDKQKLPAQWSDKVLEDTWCRNAAMKADGRSINRHEHLAEIARLTRACRDVSGSAMTCGVDDGGTAAVIAYATQRPLVLFGGLRDEGTVEFGDRTRFLRVFFTSHFEKCSETTPLPLAFAHFNTEDAATPQNLDEVLKRMQPGGVLCFSNVPFKKLQTYLPKLGKPFNSPNSDNAANLYAFIPVPKE